MTLGQTPEESSSKTPQPDGKLTEKQKADLEDAETQAKWHKEMMQQLRRMQCPGCGDDELF